MIKVLKNVENIQKGGSEEKQARGGPICIQALPVHYSSNED